MSQRASRDIQVEAYKTHGDFRLLDFKYKMQVVALFRNRISPIICQPCSFCLTYIRAILSSKYVCKETGKMNQGTHQTVPCRIDNEFQLICSNLFLRAKPLGGVSLF